jgi:neutral amino acid transport system ATP-binding protein
MAAQIKFHNVTLGYDRHPAVHHLNGEVAPGALVAVIGPNGAGKSTLFNCISGFLRPQSGRVLLDGRRIDRRSAYRIARAGLVRTFQTPRVLARMTVLENVLLAAPRHPGERLGGALAGRSREREARTRGAELLELVRLDEHASALAGTLSGGQRKLLDLVRALMTEPRILLLDEPMAGVSPALRVDLLAHVLALRERDRITLFIAEHDLDFVMRACDRVIVMNDGRVIAEGTPDEVRRDQRVVDAYLGARHS